MPRRLLSIRGRNNEKTNDSEAIIHSPEYFDFDFRHGPSVFARTPPTKDNRPFSSGLAEPRHKRQRTDSRSRPQSSNGLKTAVDKKIQLTRGENGWIGIAFGSPTHPPTGWTEDPSPVSPDHAFRFEGPFPPATPSKWKKIGGLFKAKAAFQKQPSPPIVSTEFNHEQNKLGLPIHRNPWRNPRSPPANPPVEFDSANVIRTPEFDIVSAPCESPIKLSSSKSIDLPRLEINIPSTELDRYSIMFQEINGSSSSSLSSRSHKSVTELTRSSLKDRKEAELPALPPPSPRRLTTPTLSKTPYSLFPVQARPKGRPSASPEKPRGMDSPMRSRSVSSPATLPSSDVQCPEDQVEDIGPVRSATGDDAIPAAVVHSEHTKGKAEDLLADEVVVESPKITSSQVPEAIKALEQHNIGHEQNLSYRSRTEQSPTASVQAIKPDLQIAATVVPCSSEPKPDACVDVATSPEDSVALSDRDDIPWMSTDSLQSSASSHTTVDDDIFFDVRSFRGSKGVVDSQYVISQPDSAAVQLLRSVSKKTKVKRIEPEFLNINHHDQAELFCMPPDLQAAEHYCISPDPYEAEHTLRLSMFDRAIAEVEKLASLSGTLPPCDNSFTQTAATGPKAAKMRNNTLNRPYGLTIGIPSPIAERSEEGTPNTEPGAAFLPRVRHIVTQASLRPGSIQSITPSTSGIPPPVPEKDLKFLPISKYAIQYDPIQTTTREAQAHPRQLSRSATDSFSTLQVQHPATRLPERSSTSHMPVNGNNNGSTQNPSVPSPQQALVEQRLVAVAVRPAAEVSIARTVSLSRKTSQQVLVSRAPSRRDHRSNSGNGSGSSVGTTSTEETEKLHLEHRAMSPVVMEAYKGHRPGSSMSLIVENV